MAQARIASEISGPVYIRHRPEQTLLYQLVERYYPDFSRLMALQGTPLPAYVIREFEDYLKCGRLEHGFLRVMCESCHAGKLVAFSCKRRGFCPSCGARRMVDSAALLVDEVLPRAPYRQWVLSVPFPTRTHGDETTQVFRWVNAPTQADLEVLLHRISTRLARFLVKAGILERDIEHSYLNLAHLEDNPPRQVHGHSITYRIAIGPHQGKKVFTLQTLLPRQTDDRFSQVTKAGGFSLHAGVATQSNQRNQLERICRYVARWRSTPRCPGPEG